MGTTQSLQKLNYEDVQNACSSNEYIIINTYLQRNKIVSSKKQ